MKIHIINGPNLNLLGQRETSIYGQESFEDYLERLQELLPAHEFEYYQSNVEGELVNAIQRAGTMAQGIIINPGAYGHTSLAMADAIRSIDVPAVEVHISNIYSREPIRHSLLLAPYCKGVISGVGMQGYYLAALALESII
jgi:3-dehydroquinate dehydratase-2